jgi:hypothetical protein
MKVSHARPYSWEVAPAIARAVRLVPAGNQIQLICARRDASPGSQPATNIRR